MFKTAVVAVALAGQLGCEALALKTEQTLLKRDGAGGHGGHDHGHSAPSSGYSAPASSYGAPSDGYGAPASDYGAPASSYGAPADGYGAAAPSYGGSPSYGVTGYGEEETLPDLTPIIIGILALIGLSLLFPSFVSVGRKKRHAAEEVNPLTDVADRVNDIFNAVYQSEECVQRIACEVGGIADDLKMKQNPLFRVVDGFVPEKYTAYYKQFKSGKNCEKIKCGSFPF